MIINPIYQKEASISSRSLKTPMVFALFNFVLALVALTAMSVNVNQVRITAEIKYSAFLAIFKFVAMLEFVMILLIMPALSSGSISGEREKKTFDIMRMTKMSSADIVIGKLMAAVGSIIVLVISSAPIIALVFIYGGVRLIDIVVLFASYIIAAIFIGTIGIFISALCDRTVISTACTYTAVLFITLGGAAIYMIKGIIYSGASAYTAGVLERVSAAINPLAAFSIMLSRLTGDKQLLEYILRLIGMGSESINYNMLIGAGLCFQLILAIILLALAARLVDKKGL